MNGLLHCGKIVSFKKLTLATTPVPDEATLLEAIRFVPETCSFVKVVKMAGGEKGPGSS